MDISTLVPLPVRISPELCKLTPDGARVGAGVAVCADLGVLVISSCNKLQVFALPDDIVARCYVQSELVPVRTLGGDAPMDFQFSRDSGFMAFTDGCGEATTKHTNAPLSLMLMLSPGPDPTKTTKKSSVAVAVVCRGWRSRVAVHDADTKTTTEVSCVVADLWSPLQSVTVAVRRSRGEFGCLYQLW